MIGQNVIDAIAIQKKIQERIGDLQAVSRHMEKGVDFRYYYASWYNLDDMVRPVVIKAYEDEIKRLQDELDGILIESVDGDIVVVGMPEGETETEGGE